MFYETRLISKTTRSELLVHKRLLDDSAETQFSNIMRSLEPCHESSLHQIVQNFHNTMSTVLDTVAPLKVKKMKTDRISPWLNNTDVKDNKRRCRTAERKWRKSKLTVHYNIYKDTMTTYNKAIRLARKDYFSKLISDNMGNSRVLFSTIDRLVNTPSPPPPQQSSMKCEELALFFDDKITMIRASIVPDVGLSEISKPHRTEITMREFTCITLPDLCKTVSECNSATSCLDPIPTAFLKRVFDSVSSHVLKIINMSLQTGIFPDAFKTAVVKPLLKKANLDANELKNYRPISNLPFISKILEKIVSVQINSFLKENNIMEELQSGFRTNHSTETALTKIVSDLRLNSDANKVSILVLLDLSAAFDTIDHDILINRLEKLVGLSDRVLNWFRTYIKGRKFYVKLGDHVSEKHDSSYGVAQGSCLGPLLFSLYMLPLGHIIRDHNVCFHSYGIWITDNWIT